MKRNLTTIVIGALLIIIFALLLFVFQVRQSEVAVVTTFSKPTRMAGPGPHWKWPWPIQKVYKFDQRVQNFEDKYTEGLTSDSYNLMTTVYVGWSITEPNTFYQKFPGGSITAAEQSLENLLRDRKHAVVGKHPLADFVSANPGGTKLDDIEREIFVAVQARVQTNNYGLKIEFLGIKKIGLPESVTESVFARMKSDRNLLISKSENEGAAEAQTIRSAADSKANEMLANADADATRIKSLGEAAALQSQIVFQQNPQLAGFLLRLTALEQSLKDRSTLIFDQRVPPFDLFGGFSTNLITK